MTRTPLPELMTTEEVGAFLRLDASTLRHWRRDGYGPAFTKVGRRCVYKRTDVEKWFEDQTRLTQAR